MAKATHGQTLPVIDARTASILHHLLNDIDIIQAGDDGRQWLLIPAHPALVERLACMLADAEDFEDDDPLEEPDAENDDPAEDDDPAEEEPDAENDDPAEDDEETALVPGYLGGHHDQRHAIGGH